MEKEALIIFVRNPEPGRVKTRLAKTIGPEKALLVYKELLFHTYSITKNLACDKFVYYADNIKSGDIWDAEIYCKKLQADGDLGKKMSDAFSQVFYNGYVKALIIGSDCYELSEEKLIGAFRELDNKKTVIGPATDGGYYLLGLTELVPKIFEDIEWSTSLVCAQTINILNGLSEEYILLEPLNDIDEEKDLTVALKDKIRFNDFDK